MVKKKRKRRKKSRIKKGWWNGFKIDSGWEMMYVLYCQDHGINIIRNTEKFPYTYLKKQYRWIPDFIVEGKYVEIKGREVARTFAKYKHFKHDLTILRRADLIDVFRYVETKYGKDYYKLFEKN